MPWRLMAGALAALVLIALLALWTGADEQWTLPGRDAHAAMAPSQGGAAATHPDPALFRTGLEQLPASLQGTAVDGDLQVDAHGHLVVSVGLRRVFDYFLSAVGEEPLASLQARLRAYLRSRLPPLAAAEALSLLDRYMAYKQGLSVVSPVSPVVDGQVDIASVRRQMQQVQALRQQYFSLAEAEAFFADDDTYDAYQLDRLVILQDRMLDSAQRARALAALEDTLPSALRESLKTLNQYQDLKALTSDWQQRGGSAAELRQIRENLLGPAAADRLEALDQERANWQRRWSDWQGERAAVLANKGLGEADRQQQLALLRSSRFSPDELARVEALERLQDRGEPVLP